MASRSPSPASTVRNAGPPRPREAAPRPGERDDFLASALARLNLSRPSTPALARAQPAFVDTTAPTHDDPSIWHTLSAATSAHSATSEAEDEDDEGTQSLLEGRMAAQRYADSVVLHTLGTSTTGDGSEWAHEVDGGARKRLVFYQALLVQFGAFLSFSPSRTVLFVADGARYRALRARGRPVERHRLPQAPPPDPRLHPALPRRRASRRHRLRGGTAGASLSAATSKQGTS